MHGAINADNDGFQQLSDRAIEHLERKPRVFDNFEFYGAQISTMSPHKLNFAKRFYSSNILTLPLDSILEDFRLTRAFFLWLMHTCPNATCLVNKAAQMTPSTFSCDEVKKQNEGIRQVSVTQKRGLIFKSLNTDLVNMHVYAKAYHATNNDLSLKLG